MTVIVKHHAYLLLGSNLGDRISHLQKARELIKQGCGIEKNTSSVYIAHAWGDNTGGQPHYLNQAIRLITEFSAMDLLNELLKIEKLMGRTRTSTQRWPPRIIDIDIMFYDTAVISEPCLNIPHPLMAKRKFALLPLAEIAREKEHPITHQTVETLLKNCKDNTAVSIYTAMR